MVVGRSSFRATQSHATRKTGFEDWPKVIVPIPEPLSEKDISGAGGNKGVVKCIRLLTRRGPRRPLPIAGFNAAKWILSGNDLWIKPSNDIPRPGQTCRCEIGCTKPQKPWKPEGILSIDGRRKSK
jgi:hypothetical protein